MTPQNVLQTLAEDFFVHNTAPRSEEQLLCLRTGKSEAVKRLDRHHPRLPQLVRRKPRIFLRSSHSRKATRELLCSCSDLFFALKPVSENLHFCNDCLTGEIQAGMCSSPDLTGGSKHKSGSTRLPSFCFSLSLLLAPHWHHLLPSRFTVRTVNIKERRRPCWCFQIGRKLPGGKDIP